MRKIRVKKINWRKIADFTRHLLELYYTKRIPRCAAALSYFMTLSVFPSLICLYALLGNMFPDVQQITGFLGGIFPESVVESFLDYIQYVSNHNSTALLTAGLILMGTTSAAVFRLLHSVIGDIQGESRFKGLFSVVISFIFSLVILAVVYFAVIIMITGSWFLDFVNDKLPFLNISISWNWTRFVLLFSILFLCIMGIYKIFSPRGRSESVLAGALSATIALVGVSILFSTFISISTRYPLVYGSLASIILLMLWLYICATVIFVGSAINKVLADMKEDVGELAETDD